MPVNAIRAITRCMEDINAHTSEVADAITRQELATGEISHNVAAPQHRVRPQPQRSATLRASSRDAGGHGVADGTVTRDARI